MECRPDWRTCKAAEANLVIHNTLLFVYERDEMGRFVQDEYDIDQTEEERLEGVRWLEEEDRIYMEQMTIRKNIRQLLNPDVTDTILSYVFETPTAVSITQEEYRELKRTGQW